MKAYAKWSDFRSLDRERALAALHERLPKWLALLLVAAIAWQLAHIAWMLVPADPVGDPVENRPAGATSGPAGGADVQSIAAAHLFGRADPAAAAPPAPAREIHEDLAETRLNLSLRGTIAANGGDPSLAIISAQGRDEKVYAVSDTVVSGTTLHAVYPDRVILNTGGALEALKLPKEFPEGGPANIRRSVPTAAAEAPAPDPTPSIQQVVTENVTKLADVIRPTPYFVGGEQQGYRVYPGRDRKQFAALGLRPGDLIKSVNGASLTDPQQAMEIFQGLGEADQVTVTVERNGQPQQLTLSTSQLALDDEQ